MDLKYLKAHLSFEAYGGQSILISWQMDGDDKPAKQDDLQIVQVNSLNFLIVPKTDDHLLFPLPRYLA